MEDKAIKFIDNADVSIILKRDVTPDSINNILSLLT